MEYLSCMEQMISMFEMDMQLVEVPIREAWQMIRQRQLSAFERNQNILYEQIFPSGKN